MSYYNEDWRLTDHAIQRFIERSKDKITQFQARIEMLELLNNSFKKEISPNECHYEIPNTNMIFVSINDIIVTFKWK